MTSYLIAMVMIPVLLFGWIAVQQLTRSFSLRHPELGAHREDGGCGTGNCSCGKASSCRK